MHARQSGHIQLLVEKEKCKQTQKLFKGADKLTNMTKELEGLRQNFEDLIINVPSDTKRSKGPISSEYAFEGPGPSFLDEIISVRGSDFNNFSDIFNEIPFLIGTTQFCFKISINCITLIVKPLPRVLIGQTADDVCIIYLPIFEFWEIGYQGNFTYWSIVPKIRTFFFSLDEEFILIIRLAGLVKAG